MTTRFKIVIAVSALFVMAGIGEAMATLHQEDMQYGVGDSWEFRRTDESGMVMVFSVEVTGEDKIQIEGDEYEVFVARGSGYIEEIGNLGDFSLVDGSSSVEVTFYNAKDYAEGARKTVFEMSFQLQDTNGGTVYQYQGHSETTDKIMSGARPEVVSEGTTWSLTIHENETETTIFSGGNFGEGEPETTNDENTYTTNYECLGTKSVTVSAGTFETYEIKETTLGEQGNYTLSYLSENVKREVKSVDYNANDQILSIMELLSYDVAKVESEATPGFGFLLAVSALMALLVLMNKQRC